MKILIFYSGGKDSQACLIHSIKKYGVENCRAVFCDTGWENPLTYEHIQITTNQLGVELVTIRTSKYDGFIDMAVKRGRFPSTMTRYCTEELKSFPAVDYILSLNANVIVIEGIRKNESESRSKMKDQCTYFKYYFEPYQTNSMIVESLELKQNLSVRQTERLNKAKERLKIGKEDPKFHTYRKNEVIEWCKEYNADKLRPIFNWTAEQTIGYILENNQNPNPLYYMGFSRVGCFPCVQCRLGEIKLIVENHPERVQQLKDAEALVGKNFFPPEFIPNHACSSKKYPMVEDIEKYIKAKNSTLDMFDTETPKCMSVYALCE